MVGAEARALVGFDMQHARALRRSILLALSLLSGCAAANVSSRAAGGPDGRAAGGYQGTSGEYLSGRFAATQNDMGYAADQFLKALAADPSNETLSQQAFIATLLVGRPEALRLARQQPNNPAAQLLLGDTAAANGNWDAAESRFASLPRQGLTQVLQPLVVAWAQQGAGNTDAALATLQPYVEGQRLRAIYALHAALIADLGNRPAQAAKLYSTARSEFGGTNLQLARMLASWQARQGHPTEAQDTIRALIDASPDLAIAAPALEARVGQREVKRATDGIAEAYLALAAALHAQDANDFAIVLLRLALDLRPDFTAARLLYADIGDGRKHPEAALRILAPVAADDPLIAVVRLRRAALTEQMGNTEDALSMLDQIGHDYPMRPEPLVMKGDILRGKRRFADAVTAYDAAIARVPTPKRGDWALFYDRAIALERAHMWPRAEADFQKALELSPDEPYVLNYLGYSWTEQGRNLTKARQMIERAVEQRPNDGSIVDSLGWLLLRQGDVSGAVQQLERAVELDPTDAAVNGHLGDAYWAAGRKLEAQFQWRRALTLNPEPDDAARIEAKLHGPGGEPIAAKAPATAEKTTQ
jgi:tetratricopeptide (TPR) repeat protein